MIRPNQFLEAIRHLHCIGSPEFDLIFGEQGEYEWQSLNGYYGKDIARWLCHLDEYNLKRLVEHLNEHLNNFGY